MIPSASMMNPSCVGSTLSTTASKSSPPMSKASTKFCTKIFASAAVARGFCLASARAAASTALVSSTL